jgi:hypothetical protein
MSRRHHGRSRHSRGRSDDGSRLQAQIESRPETHRDPPAERRIDAPVVDGAAQNRIMPGETLSGLNHAPPQIAPQAAVPPAAVPHDAPVNGNGHAPQPHDAIDMNGGPRAGCTAPQLRRFIKSRPYVPMHELRRRFASDGNDDDVTQVPMQDGSIYVGLPAREGSLLGELLRGGEVGYELSLDPRTPIVVGVYPMRPVPRA